MMVGWGMVATPAASSQEALLIMRRGVEQGHPYRLVVSDVHMPEVDGFEFVRQIHETPELPKAVILMLTSGERGDDIKRCRELGIASYLIKPVRRAELRAAITLAILNDGLLIDGPRLSADASDRAAKVNAGPELRILLAEDNAVNQRVVLRILEKAGHSLIIVENGRAAVGILNDRSFDLILMDIQMPEMDGFEATTLIRQRERLSGQHIPIIAMTAHAMAGDRERCLDAGMDDYISKPISAGALLELVAQWAAKKNAGWGSPSRADSHPIRLNEPQGPLLPIV